jgi:hypothetical protein
MVVGVGVIAALSAATVLIAAHPPEGDAVAAIAKTHATATRAIDRMRFGNFIAIAPWMECEVVPLLYRHQFPKTVTKFEFS